MRRISLWKQLAASLFFVLIFVSCQKQSAESVQAPLAFSSLKSSADVAYCGNSYSTPLQAGNNADNKIGTVTVGNDAEFLYLTYTIDPANDYYLREAHGYAGPQAGLPKTKQGNAIPGQFPYKQNFMTCSRVKTTTFKIPLSSLEIQNAADCANQCYIAMHASVALIPNGSDCAFPEKGETAWGVGPRINQDNGAWGMGFNYCGQTVCSEPAWCSMSQGYWFSKPNVVWTKSEVQFGDNLKVSKEAGRALWPAQSNWVRKAFFQASALQLSIPLNDGRNIHSDIADEYTTLYNFLSGCTYQQIQNGQYPAGTNVAAVQQATGAIGKWICENHCNPTEDPNCSGN